MESVKICRFKTFWMSIFAQGTFLLFRCLNIHVKMFVLLNNVVENEFKRCVYLDTTSINSSRWSSYVKICRFKASLVKIFCTENLVSV